MPNVLNLAEAIEKVRAFFASQCTPNALTLWHVLEANERVEKGVYVIRCGEHCVFETERRHEVWVDTQTGDVVHTHRIDQPPSRSAS